MGNLYERYETNTSAETGGVWVDFGDGVELRIAAFGNPRHQEVLEELRAPHQAALSAKKRLPPAVADDITVKSLAAAILVDWRGVTDKAGKALSYSTGNAETLLRDLPRLRDEVAQVALEWQNYRVAVLEDDLGNSDAGSDGPSTGASTQTGS